MGGDHRFAFEEKAKVQGYTRIAGVDEAGRGPLAGPVVAAACVFQEPLILEGIDDSKKLTPKKREYLYEELTSAPEVVWGVGIVSPEMIDEINIYQATIVAMKEAIENLSVKPDYLLIDGMNITYPGIPSEGIVRGDLLSYTIGAASILAKVTRDRIMEELDERFPVYGFKNHKGYGTLKHRLAIEEHGPCEAHRMSFEPIKSRCLV